MPLSQFVQLAEPFAGHCSLSLINYEIVQKPVLFCSKLLGYC